MKIVFVLAQPKQRLVMNACKNSADHTT